MPVSVLASLSQAMFCRTPKAGNVLAIVYILRLQAWLWNNNCGRKLILFLSKAMSKRNTALKGLSNAGVLLFAVLFGCKS